MDIMCFSETYLDSSVPVDDDNLQIPGYSSVRADHPSNKKCKGVLIYYKNFLLIKLIDVKYLHESLNFELRIGGKIFWRKGFCLLIDPLVKTKMILKIFGKPRIKFRPHG